MPGTAAFLCGIVEARVAPGDDAVTPRVDRELRDLFREDALNRAHEVAPAVAREAPGVRGLRPV